MKNTNRKPISQRVSKQGKTVVLRKSVSSTATQSESEQKREKVIEIPTEAQRGAKGTLQINPGFAARICLRKNPSQVRSLEGVVLGEREV